MVGVPSALHLSAGFLAVAAASGLSLAILTGRFSHRRDPMRLIGVAGGLVYALSHALSGALLGPPHLWGWVAAVGLAFLAIGVGPLRRVEAVSLLIPVSPTSPSYLAALAGALAALRILAVGQTAIAAAVGVGLWALAHGLTPALPVAAEWLTVAGSVSIGAWLWRISTSRILTRLLAAFVIELLALFILLSVVLSTVGAAQLTSDELDRLERLTQGIVADILTWPADAISAASAVAISPDPLLLPRDEAEAADLYSVGFASQDFVLILDAAGNRVTAHPPGLSASLELSLVGDAQVVALRSGGVQEGQTGGVLASSGRLVAFGAVGLRPEGLLPENPPEGVLVTGRLVDGLYAEQQSTALDVGVIVTVGGLPAITSEAVGLNGRAVTQELDGRVRAGVTVEEESLFAAAADVMDGATGQVVGRVIATSSPDAIASLEQTQAQRLFLVPLLGGVIGVAVAAVVLRRTVRPIGALTEMASRIEAGDLTSRAGTASPDEIGVLGRTFDAMVASLEAHQAGLTEAARTEAGLRGRLESLTASMEDGLIAVDTHGHIIQFNPAAQRLTGVSADGLLGAPLTEALPDLAATGGGGGHLAGVGGSRTLAMGDPVASTTGMARLDLLRPDGTHAAVAATAAPVRSEQGEILGRVFVLRDISRENQVEQMKTEFLANVSHELRTPITPIKGYANVLARRDVGADATRRFATEILGATVRLERIVGMIVDFAALDSGRVVLAAQPTDLPGLVAAAIDHCHDMHAGREILTRLEPGLPPVLVDPIYLRRVIDELLDNAIKFSPDGGPVVVSATVDGRHVRLVVTDSGVGIEQGRASELFADFRQVDGTETRQFGGLGLGLALVKRILDRTGAAAEVESCLGEGTTVAVLLPIGHTRATRQPGRTDDAALPAPPA